LVVKRKLTKLATTITGTIAASDTTLRITVVLIGVLVIATFTAAIIQIMPIVGWTGGIAREIAKPTAAPVKQWEDESSRKPECKVQLTASILAKAIISNIVTPNVEPVSTMVLISFHQNSVWGKAKAIMPIDNPPAWRVRLCACGGTHSVTNATED
jgi:hypothetical protein